jgi:glutaredoxin
MKHPTLTLLTASLVLVLSAGALQAQTMYRIVGADGRVTFSDTPPPSGTGQASSSNARTGAGGGSALPYALQQVVNRYPVTLYTGSSCAPCGTGRAFLNSRGIPFTERTVNTPEDAAALQRLSGDTNLPFLSIGSQQLKGFSDVEWGQFLDAAAYPKTSQLPAGYQAAAATPLVNAQAAAPATSARQGSGGEPGIETVNTRAKPAVAPPARPADTNPSGIRF